MSVTGSYSVIQSYSSVTDSIGTSVFSYWSYSALTTTTHVDNNEPVSKET